MRPGPISRILAGAATVAVVAVTVLAGQAQAAGENYAALGDSYSSGVGTDNYDPGSGDCDRSSAQGYPGLWASEHSPASFNFVACSGAKTSDVLNNQLGALSASTTLVSITIGGNDAGFSSVMENCILESDSGCKSAVDGAVSYAQNTLPGLLDNTYNAISSGAPNAHVVVLGYPRFYTIGGSCSVGISDTKRGYINGAADDLDAVISAAAGRHGFSFADVRDAFSAHEICGSGTAWLHSVDFSHITDSYHPTPDGYSGGYLPALDAND